MPNHRPPPPAAKPAATAGPNGETARATPLRWVPPGFKSETLGRDTQKALAEVVNPVYEQLVLQPRDCLERSTGLTHLYLLWEEILHHCQVAESYSSDAFERRVKDYEHNLSRYIELAKLKAATTNILLRIRQMALKRQDQDNAPHLPALPSRVQSFMDRRGNSHIRQNGKPNDQNAPGPGSQTEKSQSGAQVPSPERGPQAATGNGHLRQNGKPNDQNVPGPGSQTEKSQSGAQVPSPGPGPQAAKPQGVQQVAGRDREAAGTKRKLLASKQFPLDDLLSQKPKKITEAIAEITARPQLVF